MGGVVNIIADPFDIFDGKADKIISGGIGTDKLEDKILGNDIGFSKGESGGMFDKLVDQLAAASLPAIDPALQPKPFRRPSRTPDTEEAQLLDRRRSIAATLRRRGASSILTSGSPGDTLGG